MAGAGVSQMLMCIMIQLAYDAWISPTMQTYHENMRTYEYENMRTYEYKNMRTSEHANIKTYKYTNVTRTIKFTITVYSYRYRYTHRYIYRYRYRVVTNRKSQVVPDFNIRWKKGGPH